MMTRHLAVVLLGALALLGTPRPSFAARERRKKPKQKHQKMVHVKGADHPHPWIAGPPTEIDCSRSSSDFEYYIERCHDELTQWWVNGRCVDGVKAEVSELHRCQTFGHEERPYCHDCDDGRGNVKHVCGSDSADPLAACPVALGSNPARDCPDGGAVQGVTAYSHKCASRQTSSYQSESFYCDSKEVHESGDTFACGREWYYAYKDSDADGLRAATGDESLVGEEHPFSTPRNEHCLDCGRAIQVCAADPHATCSDLGLPARGFDAPSGEADNSRYKGDGR